MKSAYLATRSQGVSYKDVLEKMHDAERVPISLSGEDLESFGDEAHVVRLEGTPEAVNREALSFIQGGSLYMAHTAAIVLFCNPKDALRITSAIPAEEASTYIYSVCYAARPAGTVEMYIIYN